MCLPGNSKSGSVRRKDGLERVRAVEGTVERMLQCW